MEPRQSPSAVLPNDLMTEILSLLPVKPLLRFKCLNKFFKTLISDRHFVQKHLNKSKQNSNLLISQYIYENKQVVDLSLLTSPSTTSLFSGWRVVGSCNGLLCLVGGLKHHASDAFYHGMVICFWNPATRMKSEKILASSRSNLKFSFGYDLSTETYKLVAFGVELDGTNATSVVKVFSFGDSSWRYIQQFPVFPLFRLKHDRNNGVYLSGTINWLVLTPRNGSGLKQYVILSLDLSTETYTQLLLPWDFDKESSIRPTIAVLMDRLCFCHDFDDTHFVIWQMENFGVQESWIQLFKIGYDHISIFALMFKGLGFGSLFLSETRNTLILASDHDGVAFIYNCKDKRVEEIRRLDEILWYKDYVESLVSTD